MQQDRELRDLARAIAAFRKRGDARYPAELRARITSWVIAQRDRGQWWTEIAAALEIPSQTLVRWVEMQSGQAGEMRAVDVIDAPPLGTVTLVASSGIRIEGVSIEAAIAILRGIA
jgi:transposase-like protein